MLFIAYVISFGVKVVSCNRDIGYEEARSFLRISGKSVKGSLSIKLLIIHLFLWIK